MDETIARQRKIRRLLGLLAPAVKRYFRLDLEPVPYREPLILICNHVTNLDPAFLSLTLPDDLLLFVASDNILRNHPRLRGWVDRWFSPIWRRKGVSAVDTCRKMVRALREGRQVCLFAEGETTWNGRTAPIRSGTGTLVRAAGVRLVTYRLQGGYLSAPRWGRGFRRGRITGRITGTLSPEEIRAMEPGELSAFIAQGILEDAWETQRAAPVRCSGGGRTDQIGAFLFLCPHCRGIGRLKGARNRIRCGCGLDVPLDEGLLPRQNPPFADLEEWDRWQVGAFREMLRQDPDLSLREDRQDLTLWEVSGDGAPTLASRGGLTMDGREMRAGEMRFPLAEISDLALLQNRKMAIAWAGRYFELHSPRALCFRKYYFRWQWAAGKTD